MDNIGLLIQLANYNVWEKIKLNFNLIDYKYILMIHINTGMIKNKEINKIKLEYKNAIFTYGENKGMDILGFIKQIEYIINNDIKIDYILKIHTKSDDKWRNELIDPLIKNFNNCLKILKSEKVGMICAKKWFKLMDHYNSPIISKLLKFWEIENNFIDEIDWKNKYENLYDLEFFDPKFYITYPYNKIMHDDDILQNEDKLNSYAIFHWLNIGYKVFKYVINEKLIIKKIKDHKRFCAGTIFWVKSELLLNFFKKYVDFNSLYDNFEEGYFLNDKPTFTHSWERLFSIIVYHSKKEIRTI